MRLSNDSLVPPVLFLTLGADYGQGHIAAHFELRAACGSKRGCFAGIIGSGSFSNGRYETWASSRAVYISHPVFTINIGRIVSFSVDPTCHDMELPTRITDHITRFVFHMEVIFP